MSERMMTESEWQAQLDKTTKLSDADERLAKIERISSDPKPQWAAEPVRDYPTTEKHYIVCIDEGKGNASLSDAFFEYGEPHKFGAILISDRKEVPSGWVKTPPRGTPIETIKETQPALYEFMRDKKIERF